MKIAISDEVPAQLARLSNNEAAAVWDFMNKFLRASALPSLHLEKLKGNDFWSARINQGLRAILAESQNGFVLVWVDHHNTAYDWASRRRVAGFEDNSIRIVESAVTPEFLESPPAPPETRLFDGYSDELLTRLGLKPEWLEVLRGFKSVDEFLDGVEAWPAWVQDDLLNLLTGAKITTPRIFPLESEEQIRPLLRQPFEAWAVFLHPSQERLARGDFKGPVKVTGPAGTGKTVVALHRAAYLAQAGQKVLLTTYVNTLVNDLEARLALLLPDPQAQSRVSISTVHEAARRLGPLPAGLIYTGELKNHLEPYRGGSFPLEATFLLNEWEKVIEPLGVTSWEAYQAASRKGRGRALTMDQRYQVWEVLGGLQHSMAQAGTQTWGQLFDQLAQKLNSGQLNSPYDSVLVDEVQDLTVPELKFLAALSGTRQSLMLFGDGAQRIYHTPVSLRQAGIETRGRSHRLKINYRTTREIRSKAQALLLETVGFDEQIEPWLPVRDLLAGPEPVLRGLRDPADEANFIAHQVQQLLAEGITLEEIAIFARTEGALKGLASALDELNIPQALLSKSSPTKGTVRLATMHRAKGLEFRVVFVARLSSSELPNSWALVNAESPEEALALERQLLHVAMTRARDRLWLTWSGEPSPLLGRQP